MKFVFPEDVYPSGVKCPLCHAQPGQPCRELSNPKRRAQQTHPERAKVAEQHELEEVAPGLSKQMMLDTYMITMRAPGYGAVKSRRVMDAALAAENPAEECLRIIREYDDLRVASHLEQLNRLYPERTDNLESANALRTAYTR